MTRHVAVREAAVDFTHATELGVTIRGALLERLLFEFVMSFSGWTLVCLAFGETYTRPPTNAHRGIDPAAAPVEAVKYQYLLLVLSSLRTFAASPSGPM